MCLSDFLWGILHPQSIDSCQIFILILCPQFQDLPSTTLKPLKFRNNVSEIFSYSSLSFWGYLLRVSQSPQFPSSTIRVPQRRKIQKPKKLSTPNSNLRSICAFLSPLDLWHCWSFLPDAFLVHPIFHYTELSRLDSQLWFILLAFAY